MQIIPGISRCSTHDLLIRLNQTKCLACYHNDPSEDLLEAFRICEAHQPTMVNPTALSCFDPREHCFKCSDKF